MGILDAFRSRNEKKGRKKYRKKTWLEGAVKDFTPVLNTMKNDNPVIQAAIIKAATGIEISSKDIKLKTPEDEFESKVALLALKDIEGDEDFMNEAKASLLDKWRSGDHRAKRRHYYGPSRDGDGYEEDFRFGYGYPGNENNDPVDLVERYKSLKEAMKGETGGMLQSLVETLGPELIRGFFNRGPAPQNNGPQLIAVEIDGRYVQMTKEGFEVYQRQKEQLRLASSSVVPPAATTAATPAPAPTPTPSTDASPPAPATTANAEPAPAVTPAGEAKPVLVGEEVVGVIIPPQALAPLIQIAKAFEKGMEKSPDKFATQLYEDSLTGEPDSVFVFNMLAKLSNVDEAIEKLKPYRVNPELVPFITKLEAKREWCDKALTALKQLKEKEDEH